MLLALVTLLAMRVVPLDRGLEGFANEGLLSVMVLFCVAAGVSETGALDYYMERLLGKPSQIANAQVRLMVPIAIVSAFINNTPVVAIMIPIVQKWARSLAVDPKQLLIPLSFSSILGGTCTMIGTSTNLIVRGKYSDRFSDTLPIFGLGKFGVPVALIGLSYILLTSPFLLAGGKRRHVPRTEQSSALATGPDINESRKATEHLGKTQSHHANAYNESGDEEENQPLTLCAIIPGGSTFANKTIQSAGLRGLEGLYIVSVERGDVLARGVGPEFVLQEGDMLHFAGEVEKLTDVCSQKGLVPLTNEVEEMIDTGVADCADECGDDLSDDSAHELQQYYQWYPQSSQSQQGAIAAAAAAVSKRSGGSCVSKYPKLLSKLTYSTPGSDVASTSSDRTVEHMTRVKSVSDLIEDRSTPEDLRESLSTGATLVRAKVKQGSSLIGRNARDVGFRGWYKAAIIAVRRAGKPVEGKLGHIVFQEGDILLVQAGSDSPLLGDLNRHESSAQQQQQHSTVSDERRGQPYLDRNNNRFGSRDGNSLDSIDEHGSVVVSSSSNDDSTLQHAVGNDLQVLQQDGHNASREQQSFMTYMRVQPDSPIIGQTIERAGLRGLPGLFLASIHRENGDPLPAVSPDEVVKANDVLSFAGELHSVASLRRIPGVVPHTNQVNKLQEKHENRRLVQAVIATHSSLVGKTVKQVGFRSKYDAVIIAVKRSGGRINKRIGDIELLPGDVLLLDTGRTFIEHHRNDPAFALVSELDNSSPPRFNKLLPALFFVAAMVAVTVGTGNTSHPIPLFVSAALASAGMVSTGCVTQEQVKRALRWDVYVTIGAAFGISAAIEDTGVAQKVANGLVTAANKVGFEEVGLYIAIYLATVLLSNIVVNNAAAALMFPIAVNAALQQGVDVVRISYLLMLGASAAFTTPFGYQTNLMVFAAGGYRFFHFVEFGGPMQIVLLIATVAIVSAAKYWYLSWVVSLAIFLFAVCNRFIVSLVQQPCLRTKLRAFFPGKSDACSNWQGKSSPCLECHPQTNGESNV